MLDKITDENGNVATVDYWGSEEAARAALATLKNCRNCINCLRCSRCSDCSYCSDCSRCSDCSYCSDCSRCSDCSYCSDCSRCSCKKGNTGDHIHPTVPKIENIHQVVYAAASQPGALNMSQWHCGTTHCRAGWVVTLAGEAGKALEDYWSTNHAAWLIYKASDPNIAGRPDFFCDNATALADMKRLADEEAARNAAAFGEN